MKNKILMMLVVLTVGATAMTGCSEKPKTEGENISAEESESEAEVSEVKGTMEEIKDSMFIVTDSNGAGYVFSFDEKPEGLDKVEVGDRVVVKYTGTISEIDPFEGEVLSVKKI